MTSMIDTCTSASAAPRRDWRKQISQAAPFMIIAAAVLFAMWIVVGEWRDGSIGVQRVVDSRAVVFEPRPDGTLAVHLTRADGSTNRVDLPSSMEGFVATMAKSLNRDRLRFDVAFTLPYQLLRFENGTLMIKDPVIGTEVRLEAFGPTNVGSFAALMVAQPQSDRSAKP
jgi:putative photosynthetic complex assembly protein